MAEHDARIRLFGLEDEYAAQDRAYWNPVEVNVFPAKRLKAIGFSPEMYQALCASDTSLAHTHGLWMYPSIAAYRWSKKARKPYVVSPHGMLDSWALSNSRYKKIFAGLLYENRHLKEAGCIHALCSAEAETVRSYGLKNPICIIPNGIDVNENRGHREAPWKGRIEEGRKVLLYLGRIHPKKGLRNLLYAWALLKKGGAPQINEWAIVIAGWDQCGCENELKEISAELKLTDSVFFPGPLFHEKKNAAYSFSDGFILPSLSEGFPMVILEAWAHSLPVLMTPQCNVPEGFEKGAAIRIESDPAAIAEGLTAMFEMSGNERKEMGRRGLDLVRKCFSWPHAAGQMKHVYDWVLGGGQPPSCVRFG